tara:strand:- start:6 stop:323 length:318 start_codon:yes stop_codon:yes gene_type:complete
MSRKYRGVIPNSEKEDYLHDDNLYLVSREDLKHFYDAMGRVADALMLMECDYEQYTVLTDIWNENVGGTFEYMFKGQKLRSQDYEKLGAVIIQFEEQFCGEKVSE